ncbi:insulinase family protein [Olivibacter sp. SDN3]|uniref:M16 family metallopeptidase n=1 Tax=Olivibacter sp. SDN3 TaxID=2764720 RepID=UPI00165105DC|nr:pitrilysin family protein [Olivibacter sp. SDN3]QNL50493.1 insulinase family protein [Olivibacter sp. SDN3]
MKTIRYIFIFIVSIGSAYAQVDRTKYPEAGPAPQINIGDAETFTLDNGLKVFVVENHKLPRVNFSLVLDRDPLLEGDKAGLTGLVGGMMMGGTATRSKDQLDEEIDMIGGSISFGSASANASSLTKYQDKLLTLFADILLNPSFPQSELDKLKKQTISGIASAKDDPNAISSIVSSAVLYGKDHPYGEVETEKTVSNISVDDIKAYYDAYFKPNIGYLAIVGDITKKEAELLVKKYFSTWEKGDVSKKEWPAPSAPEKTTVVLVNRPSSVQSVMNVTYPVELKHNNPDALPLQVLNNILGGGSAGRLFQNLREDKGYTYGAYSSLSPNKIVGSFSANASVRTEVTDSAAYQFFQELKKLDQGSITEEELTSSKAILSGDFGRSLEQPATIARFAINTELQELPADYYKNYLKSLDGVTVDQLNALAPKYIKPDNAYLVIVGNTDAFADQIQQFGEVKYYTNTGDAEVKTEVQDASITAEKVIANYLEAIGGTEKLAAVKTLKSIQEAEIQGMSITVELAIDKTQPVAVQTMKMGEQVMSKIVVHPDKALITAQGQEQEAPAEMFNALKQLLEIFPELNYETGNVNLELDGMVKVNDEDAYKVNVSHPDGNKRVNYYSVSSGLKLKTESAAEGEAEINEYKEYDGIKLPSISTVKNPNVPVPLKLITVEQLINPALTAEELK